MTKRFEPSREREVLIALDVQTIDGPAWEAGFGSDEVESLYVVAGSLARTLGKRRVAFGLMAAGYTGAETRIASVAVSSAPGQVQRVLDLLARLSSHASAPFERLLAMVARSVRPGTTVLVLTARDPRRSRPRSGGWSGAGPTSSSSRAVRRRSGRPRARGRWGSRRGGPSSTPWRPPSDWSVRPRSAVVVARDVLTAEPVDPAATNPTPRPARRCSPLVLAPIALALLAEAAWTRARRPAAGVPLRAQTAGIPADPARVRRRARGPPRAQPRAGDHWPARRPASRSGSPRSGGWPPPEVRAILGERRDRRLGAAIIANLGRLRRRPSRSSGASRTRACHRTRARSGRRSRSARRGSRWRRSSAGWSATRGGGRSSTRRPARWSCSWSRGSPR